VTFPAHTGPRTLATIATDAVRDINDQLFSAFKAVTVELSLMKATLFDMRNKKPLLANITRSNVPRLCRYA
jgi:hypothetical protein